MKTDVIKMRIDSEIKIELEKIATLHKRAFSSDDVADCDKISIDDFCERMRKLSASTN